MSKMSSSQYNPDCGYAWIVVAAGFTINFIMAGLARASGVLYVALIDVYAVSREVATAPFSIRFCVRNVSGPLVGALGQRFGIRPVVLLGGLVCGLGGILSALAPNVTWITVAWGGIHGLGYGMCNLIHFIVINRYFHKYKGLATGLCLTGDCFGTFLLPLLLEFLLEIYDVKGTFLILAGISLNVVPAAMLLRSPPWEESDPSSTTATKDIKHATGNNELRKRGISNEGFDITQEQCEIKVPRNSVPAITINEQKHNQNAIENSQTLSFSDKNFGLNSSKQPYMHCIDFYCNNKYKNHRLSDTVMSNEIYSLRESASLRVTDKNMKKRRYSNAYNTNRKNSQISVCSVFSCPSHIGKCTPETRCKNQFLHPSSAYLQATNENGCLTAQSGHFCDQNRKNDTVTESCAAKLNESQSPRKLSIRPSLYGEKILNLELLENIDTKDYRSDSHVTERSQQSAFLQLCKTNIKPMFLIMSTTLALYVFLFISVFTIIIDYASDNNMPSEYGKYLIISFSVTDLFGRLGFGVVLDKKWIRFSYFAGLTTGLMGFCMLIIPLYKCFAFWLISFSLCGFVQGGTCVMFPILVQHYMEKNEESVALGSLNFYGGLLMLPIPPMIGYFRDNIGSYDGVFWTVGALCIFAASLWIFEPCIVQRQEKKKCQNAYFSKD